MNKKRPFLKKMNWNTKEDGTKISSSIEDLKWFLSQTSVGRCQCDQIGQFVTLWETKFFLQKLMTLGPLFKTSLFNYHKQFWLILGQHFEILGYFLFQHLFTLAGIDKISILMEDPFFSISLLQQMKFHLNSA